MKRIFLLFLGILLFGITYAQEKYGVIVASTININKAFMLRSSYLDIGFADTEVLIQKGGPNYRICIGVYDTRDNAVSVREKYKKEYRIPRDSWLLKIYDYKKTARKELKGEFQGKTITILDSTKIEDVKLKHKELEEKFYVLDSNIQEIKTLNVGIEKKISDLETKQKESALTFEPVWKPLVMNDSLGFDISQNMSVYGILSGMVTGVDPARIMFGGIIGGEFNFAEKLHALMEVQLFWEADRKINILGGIKFDMYDRANIILSGLVKLGYANIRPDGPVSSNDAFVFQIGFAPEIRLTNEFSLYMQMLYSGSVVNSSIDDDIIGAIGIKYYF